MEKVGRSVKIVCWPPFANCCWDKLNLKLTRPERFAVSSPSFHATQPCAASCSVIAVNTGSTQIEAEYINAEMSSITRNHP